MCHQLSLDIKRKLSTFNNLHKVANIAVKYVFDASGNGTNYLFDHGVFYTL